MGIAATALTGLVLTLFPAAAGAREQSAAIFDFELTDTSRDNQLAPTGAAHLARLALVSERLHTQLAQSRRFSVVDISAGDIDESWTRTLDWLVRNRLLDAEGGGPQ